jgi:hypothetical protein
MVERGSDIDVGDCERPCGTSANKLDEVVEGIIRKLKSRWEDMWPAVAFDFQVLSGDELDIPGLEVPERED